MELWHNTPDAFRSPDEVVEGVPVGLWIGTWPIEMGQYVSVEWTVTGKGRVRKQEEVQAYWQYNDDAKGNSYWLATIGPFHVNDHVEYVVKGMSQGGPTEGTVYSFDVAPTPS